MRVQQQPLVVDPAAVRRFQIRTVDPAVAPPPICGSPEWVALDDRDPRKLAALLRAGLCWVTETALLPYTLADELAAADCEVRARLKAMSVDLAGALDWSAAAHRLTRYREFETAHPWSKRVIR